MVEIKHIQTKEEFEEIIKKDVPTLVDFFATWCGPCQVMGVILEELANQDRYQNADKVQIIKIDIDEAEEISQEFDIMSVPTLMIFKSGKATETMTGVRTADELKAKLDSLI